jgi:hypothetical protein
MCCINAKMKNLRFSQPSRKVVQKVPVSRLIPVLSTESIMGDLNDSNSVFSGVWATLILTTTIQHKIKIEKFYNKGQ